MDTPIKSTEKQTENIKLRQSTLFRLKEAKLKHEQRLKRVISYSEFIDCILASLDNVGEVYSIFDSVFNKDK